MGPASKKQRKQPDASTPDAPASEEGWLGILGPVEMARVLNGSKMPHRWVKVPDARVALGRDLRKGERKDVVARKPTEEERRAYQKEYRDLVREKVVPRLKLVIRQMSKLVAALEEETLVEVFSAGAQVEEPSFSASDYDVLRRELAAAIGWQKVPVERGGRGEEFFQRWLAADQTGLAERYGEGMGPVVEVRFPLLSGWRLGETHALRPIARDHTRTAQPPGVPGAAIRKAARRAPRPRKPKTPKDEDA